MKQKLSIVKIGGNVIEDKEELTKFLKLFAQLDGLKILVHGGGKKASEILKKMGIAPKIVDGRRITDAESLEVITMVYGGLTNKNIVAELQAYTCNAIGLSGADANMIPAHKRPVGQIDYGFAGDVDGVNGSLLSQLLGLGLTPVFCALTHDGRGQLLNTNADTIAAEVAVHMSEWYQTTLYYCFEKKGVLKNISDEDSVIKHLDPKSYATHLDKGIIYDGMIPKLDNCFNALGRGVNEVRIGNSSMLETNTDTYTSITM